MQGLLFAAAALAALLALLSGAPRAGAQGWSDPPLTLQSGFPQEVDVASDDLGNDYVSLFHGLTSMSIFEGVDEDLDPATPVYTDTLPGEVSQENDIAADGDKAATTLLYEHETTPPIRGTVAAVRRGDTAWPPSTEAQELSLPAVSNDFQAWRVGLDVNDVGAAVAAWHRNNRIWAAVRRPGRPAFGQAAKLGPTASGDLFAANTGPGRTALVAWVNDNLELVARRHGRNGWGRLRRLSRGPVGAVDAELDPNGKAWIVFEREDDILARTWKRRRVKPAVELGSGYLPRVDVAPNPNDGGKMWPLIAWGDGQTQAGKAVSALTQPLAPVTFGSGLQELEVELGDSPYGAIAWIGNSGPDEAVLARTGLLTGLDQFPDVVVESGAQYSRLALAAGGSGGAPIAAYIDDDAADAKVALYDPGT